MIDKLLCWIGQFLGWLDKITGNYMLALFIFAILVEIIMLPIGIRQQKNTIKQAKLRPKEMAIRNRYKGRTDKITVQKMNEEIQRMYQDENYNQLSGCLPLLLQLPVILALYQVVINPLHYVIGISKNAITAFEAFLKDTGEFGLGLENINTSRGTIGLIDQLRTLGADGIRNFASFVESKPEALSKLKLEAGAGQTFLDEFTSKLDSLPDFKALGINLAETPTKKISWLWLVPVLTFVVYYFSMRISRKLSYQPAQSGDPATDKATGCSNTVMDITMPLFSVYITFIVPAAIGVYWIFKSIIGTLKSFILYKAMPLPEFTEEDYKAAEKEYAGKAPKDKVRYDLDTTQNSSKSLFRQDAEDYVAPEVNDKISAKLSESDPDSNGPIAKAPLKDESDKEKK